MRSAWDDNGTYTVQLQGEWTVCQAQQHLQEAALESLRISDRALRYSESNPSGSITTELDLNGITTLDDSGSRILLLWRDHLEKQGFHPVIRHADPGFWQTISGKDRR